MPAAIPLLERLHIEVSKFPQRPIATALRFPCP